MLLSCCFVCLVALTVGSGTAHAALTCGSCHGMPPIDGTVRTPSSGAFQGNHQTHSPASAQPADCSRCHDVTGFTNNHRDGVIRLIPNINASPGTGEYKVGGSPVTFKNQTTVPVLGSCSNVNCHFERTSPDWGTPYLGGRSDAVCSTCHDSVPTTNAHSKHTAFYVAKNGGVAADTCNNCHVTNYADATHASQVGRPINVTLASGKYSTAMKTSYLPSQQAGRVEGDCSNLYCHSNGSGTFANPNWGIPASGACGTCHAAPPTSATHTTFGAAANTCSTCHVFTDVTGTTHINTTIDKTALLLEQPHKNNKVLGMYSAAYITSRSTCADCHNTTAGNQAIRQQWAASSHGNTYGLGWVDYDFKTRNTCVRCHTTTGFIAYSTAKITTAWGTAGDVGTKEVLTCKGCHSDVAAGTVRIVTPNKPFTSYTAFRNANVGPSNICMDCHGGRDTGTDYIKRTATIKTYSSASLYQSHYLPAGGTLQGKVGYNYRSTYPALSDNSHGKVGMLDANSTGTDGPCVACHMNATDKHKFEPVTKDGSGVITAITAGICTNCHSSSLPAATLDAKRVAFNDALEVLRIMLQDKGYTWTAATDNFNNGHKGINWGQAATGGKDVLGAAHNYKLFLKEPGMYTHNPEYARQLIVDSIIAVYNKGTLVDFATINTDTELSAALAYLQGKGSITQTQTDKLIAYKNPESSCGSCHGNPPATATHTTFGSAADTCSTCHVFTGVNGATHLNGATDKTALLLEQPHKNNKVLGMYSAAYITSRSTCADCHNTTAGNQAIRQQWAASSHGNTYGLGWVDYDFKTRNTCVRCHTTTGFIAYSTAKITTAWGTAGDVGTKEVLTCKGCHSDVAAGTVRIVTPNKPFTSYTAFRNANVGPSNICMDCHGGRDTGTDYIKRTATIKTYSSASLYQSHYLPAGGTLQGKVGYNYRSTYPALSDNSHGKVGMLDANSTGTDGPCVACHMNATDKHKFEPVTKDGSGVITAITAGICTNCHSSSLPAATLDAKRVAFNDALEVLRIMLQDKGYTWTAATDNFNNGHKGINWGQAATGGKDVLGAAHNYKLFLKEPGMYTHNPEYARQLIVDSIIAVYNKGTLVDFATINTDTELSAALAYLQGKGSITQTQTDKLIAYKNPESSCTTCHGNPPATATHTGIEAGTCASCHIFTGVNGATHNNGSVDLDLDGASCNSCHGYPPAPRVTEGQLTFGVQGQWSSARFEDYSGGGGAHLIAGHVLNTVKPSDGWTPCLTCHSGGASNHSRTLPLRNHVENVTVKVDAARQFSNATLPVYTSAKLSSGGGNQTGNCFNASCHFRPSPKWSLER